MKTSFHRLARSTRSTSIFIAFLTLPWMAAAQFQITTSIGSTAQDFDMLITTGTNQSWTNDTSPVPGDSTLDGWSLFEFTQGPITSYGANSGSSGTGSFYSFGLSDATERALGGVGSGGPYFGSPPIGAVAGYMAFAALNDSGVNLASFALGFDGEQWRNGGNESAHTMVLEYGFGTTFDAVSTWIAPGESFDWSSPEVGSTAAEVDGNTSGSAPGHGGSISGLDWSSGQTLWIRWIERNDPGNDHGLAIDNVTFAWEAVPEPGALSLLLAGLPFAMRRNRAV